MVVIASWLVALCCSLFDTGCVASFMLLAPVWALLNWRHSDFNFLPVVRAPITHTEETHVTSVSLSIRFQDLILLGVRSAVDDNLRMHNPLWPMSCRICFSGGNQPRLFPSLLLVSYTMFFFNCFSVELVQLMACCSLWVIVIAFISLITVLRTSFHCQVAC